MLLGPRPARFSCMLPSQALKISSNFLKIKLTEVALGLRSSFKFHKHDGLPRELSIGFLCGCFLSAFLHSLWMQPRSCRKSYWSGSARSKYVSCVSWQRKEKIQIGEFGVNFSESIILFLSKWEPGALMPVLTKPTQDYFPKCLPHYLLNSQHTSTKSTYRGRDSDERFVLLPPIALAALRGTLSTFHAKTNGI